MDVSDYRSFDQHPLGAFQQRQGDQEILARFVAAALDWARKSALLSGVQRRRYLAQDDETR